MSQARYHRKHLLLVLCLGGLIGYGAHHAIYTGLHAPEQPLLSEETAAPEPVAPAQDLEQLRKDLSTRFIGDPRTLGEKLRDFVADNAIAQTIPLACKVIADLAENPDALSNQELVELYQSQTHAELKRVVAQVLSLRGDNQLLDAYVAETAQALKSTNPVAQRAGLQALAKTRFAGAALVVVPVLQSSDTSVLLDALLALRATGNESHLGALEPLLNHSDASVSWLAQDAYKQLQNLSTRARTQISLADLSAELPV